MTMRSYNPTCALPEELIALDQWIVWKAVPKPGKPKPDKVPRDRANTRNVDAHGRANQMPHDDAVAAYNANPSLAGIGIAIREENGIVGIDLDHVIDLKTGEVDPAALEIVRDLGTYCEVSPSGDGLRLFMLGSLPKEARRMVGNIEVYDSGRFLTVTGNVFGADLPIVRNDAALDRLVASMESESRADKSPSTSSAAPVVIDDATKAELRSALASLRADDRDLWIGVAHDLHEVGEVGRALWLEWSQTSDKYQPGDAQQWDSIKSSRSGYRNVFARAQRAGWCNPMKGSVASVPSTALVRYAEAQDCTLRAVDLDLQSAALAPPEFVVDKIVPRRLVTLFSGNGGIGKSTLALVMAVCKAAGRDFLGFPAPRGRVVYVSLEDEPSIVQWRLRTICTLLGVDPGTLRGWLTIADGTDGDAALVVERSENGVRKVAPTANMDRLRALTAGAELVIVDNASDAYDADENVRRQVRGFVRLLTGIARANNGAIVLLAHIDKNSAKHGGHGQTFSGSSAWNNSVRSRLAFVEHDGALELRHEKSNFGAKAAAIRLVIGEHGVPMPGPGIAQDGGALLVTDDAEAVLTALCAATGKGERVSPSRLGSYTAQKALALHGLPDALCGASGRRRFWAAVDRLLVEGRALNASVKDRHRNTVPALLPAPCVEALRCVESPIPPTQRNALGRVLALNALNDIQRTFNAHSTQPRKPEPAATPKP